MDSFLYRKHARALRGEKVVAEISGKKFKRISIVAGKCGKNIISPLSYKGTADSELFEFWFEHGLLAELPEGKTIVVDNATIHRKAKLRELAENAGCSVLFLPPYSPDLNPIENFWAWIKRKMQDNLKLFDNFDDALFDCF